MRVRRFVKADRAACLRVFDSNVPEFFTEAEREQYASFLDRLPEPYLVVENEDGVVACGGYAVAPDAGFADLCWGMVHREEHRKGIGTLLLQERLRRIAGETEVEGVRLDTSQHTRAYYERIGFRLLQVTPNGYGPGLDRCDMRLDQLPALPASPSEPGQVPA
jgi:N-acetylglutamate synthase-like GNAT family acetyltransferase